MRYAVSLSMLCAACSMEVGALPGTPGNVDAEAAGDGAGLPVVTPVVDGAVRDATPDSLDPDTSVAPADAGTVDAERPDVGPPDASACSPVAETCDGTDQDCDGAVDEDTSCPCPRYTFAGSTYLFCLGVDDFSGAQRRCRSVGYDLVTIESAAEDAWLWSTIESMTAEEVWIGLSDRASEGTFVWPDGTVQRTPSGDVGYSGWASTAPDNLGDEDCVELDRGRGGVWEDVSCDQRQTAICEAP